jgi:hypothetical protein
VADREFVFANPEVRKLLTEKFVPLAMDDWYLRQQKDDNGRFFIAMTAASPRGDAGDNTRQGRYVFTAAGKYLDFNNNRDPERILSMLRTSLRTYGKLSERDRKPEGEIGAVTPEPRFDRTPPKNGAIVNVFTRVLEKKPEGSLSICSAPPQEVGNFRHRGFGAAIDHLWLREEDVKSLLPAREAKPGVPIPFPEALSVRLTRFHLCDNSRGEPPHWSRSEIKKAEIFLTPESAGRAKLTGSFHLETKDGKRGFTGDMDGWVEYKNGRLTEWKAVVTGEHWGQGQYTPGARPGKTPIGFAFVLCPKPGPADLVPPQGSRWLQGYYEAGQH